MADTRETLTADIARQHVRDVLFEPEAELTEDTDVIDAGLDSIRVMTLVEQWRAAGIEVTFADLAERPTFGEWLVLLAERQNGAHGG